MQETIYKNMSEREPNNDRLDPYQVKYCQLPSDWFNELLEADGDDPRSAIGRYAIETGVQLDSRSPVQIGNPTPSNKTK